MTVNGMPKEKLTKVKHKQSLKRDASKSETNLGGRCDAVPELASKRCASRLVEQSDLKCDLESKVETLNKKIHQESSWTVSRISLSKTCKGIKKVKTEDASSTSLNGTEMTVETENGGVRWYVILSVLIILAIGTRLRNIKDPDHVW